MSLNAFLTEIVSSLRSTNGQRIAELIHLDVQNLPADRQQPYFQLNTELNSQYPKGRDASLSDRCRSVVPIDEFGSFSASFAESIVRYFRYLRDFTKTDEVQKALEIQQLTSQCVIALGDSRYGIVMIPIVLSFSRTLAKIAATLDRNRIRAAILPSDSGSRVSFVEATANVLRDAFIKCLAGSPGTPRLSRPQASDKRIGIYLTANSTLALLTRSGKLRNAQQIFTSIDAQSPPLSYYPAAQRVSYLYYLGRYHFANNHFLRASIVLESVYRQTHPSFLKQRRLILIYLIAANLTLGRLPSLQLLMRPECASIGALFMPLMLFMRVGDIGAFHAYLDIHPHPSPQAQFFLKHRILLQLRNRCEVHVWRSLIRATFRAAGYIPPLEGPDARKVPYLYASHVRHAATYSFQRMPSRYYDTIMTYVHPEFRGAKDALQTHGFDLEDGMYKDDLVGIAQDDPFPPLIDQDEETHHPTLHAVENTFMSLIGQGFLGGFMVHSPEGRHRWAIAGAKQRGGALPAGFPVVYSSIISRAGEMEEDVDLIPGWVKEEQIRGRAGVAAAGSLAGRVVRLGNVRPVGPQS